MRVARPTGEYAERMLDPGGWPEADEDALYERALQYLRVLHQLTKVLETCQQQQAEVFDGGAWSGTAAGAASGELSTNIGGLMNLQSGLVTVVTWHRYVAMSVVQAKSDITDNVDVARQRINALEKDSTLDAEERAAAINNVVVATYGANTSVMEGAAERILASKAWKPASSALEDLLAQKPPPPVELPVTEEPPAEEEQPRPSPEQPAPVTPPPVMPAGPEQPAPVTPPPVMPAGPEQPAPVTPPPVMPAGPPQPSPGAPPPGVGAQPTPGTPGKSDQPAARPTPGAGGTTPTAPAAPGAPGGAGDQPAAPLRPATPAARLSPAASGQSPDAGRRGKGVAPASASVVSSAQAAGREDAASVTPAGAGGMAGAPMAPGGAPGGASGGSGARSGGGSRAPVGEKPADKAASTRPAAAKRAPARPAPAAHPEHPKSTDRTERADAVTVVPPVPVSAARAARDAVAEVADAARRAGPDQLKLARRIAAALNAPDSGGEGDFGFFWVTAVTTGGSIVVANSYGVAYIPEGVQLPEEVYMASADEAIPVAERAHWATYPVMAVQGWAAHHDVKLRAVIATEEQFAKSDPGVTKIVLEPDDIPETGDMVGRSRLEVVDPEAAERLAATSDPRLLDLLPLAPEGAEPSADQHRPSEIMDPEAHAKLAAALEAGSADLQQALAELPATSPDAGPPRDQRPTLWFDVMKPMMSTADGRTVAHLRAFHAYAGAAREAVLGEAHAAADPDAQRCAVAEWLYWKHVAGLLDAAVPDAAGARGSVGVSSPAGRS